MAGGRNIIINGHRESHVVPRSWVYPALAYTQDRWGFLRVYPKLFRLHPRCVLSAFSGMMRPVMPLHATHTITRSSPHYVTKVVVAVVSRLCCRR